MLKKPSKKILKSLSKHRSYILTSLHYLSVNNQGVGFATPEFIKETYMKIVDGKMKESEWFAMEMQSRSLISKCEELFALGVPINGKGT